MAKWTECTIKIMGIKQMLQVSLLKPSWKMSVLSHTCAGPFLVYIKRNIGNISISGRLLLWGRSRINTVTGTGRYNSSHTWQFLGTNSKENQHNSFYCPWNITAGKIISIFNGCSVQIEFFFHKDNSSASGQSQGLLSDSKQKLFSRVMECSRHWKTIIKFYLA